MSNELVLRDHDFNGAAGQVDQFSRHVVRRSPLTRYRGHATYGQGYLCHHGCKELRGVPVWRFRHGRLQRRE